MSARIVLLILACFFVTSGQAQSKKSKSKKSTTLFTVDGKPVSVDEFIYLYNKNHQAKPEEYTKENIEEYLRLFINFKLKVAEAKDRGMDTTATFINEFTSYRNELLKPYLPDDKIVDSLVALTYNHLKEEVRASHILIELKPNPTPEDTLEAHNKIIALKKRIEGGEDFGQVALTNSEDPSAQTNKGDLGYFTALQMVYPFEAAAYSAKVGQVTGPVRTQFGYHLILVTDRKPSRGEVEVSHIMIRSQNPQEDTKAKNTIFNVFDQLQAGASWEELCAQYSEDQSSKQNAGRLRPFGVRAMAPVPEFEAVAFSLQKPGQISDPFTTAYGWHIVRLENKSPLPSFDEMSTQLKSRVTRDDRLKISKEVWQAKLRKENGFMENITAKTSVKLHLDSLLPSGKSVLLTDKGKETLFTLTGKPSTVNDFLMFADKSMKTKGRKDLTFETLYDEYTDTKLMELLEQRVANENSEFRMLVNEYYEGILLFEIMEDEVWNKASEDSVGQRMFFEENKSQYQAGQRVRADLYYDATANFQEPLKARLEKGDSAAIADFVASRKLKYESGLYEKGDKPVLDKIDWSVGIYSAENNGMYYLARVHAVLPPGQKTFDEARASVIADYQQQLENDWVTELRKQHPVKVNEKAKKHVLERLQG